VNLLSGIVSSGGMAPDGGAKPPRSIASRQDLLQLQRASDVSLVPHPEKVDSVVARFWNGDHRCYGAMSRVTETPAAVTVEIFTGVLPEANGQPCTAVAELQELEIKLAGPLAGRTLR
jgi:hypothetical protein